MIQESLGFSPAELVFANSVHGLLKLLREKLLHNDEPQNILDYVSNFHFKLHRACELAKQSLTMAQEKMKGWFDKNA